MKRDDKRGQVSIFIIIAIIVVVLGIIIYLVYPRIGIDIGDETQNPSAFLQSCLEDEISTAVETLSLQGGSLEPEHYVLYDDEKIEYLCFTEEYYKPCIVQQPLLKKHIEDEIKSEIKAEVNGCLDSMKESYEKKGYDVGLIKGDFVIELLPKRIVTTLDSTLTLTKGGSETHDLFRVVLNNNLYELVSITDSIISWETRYGDAETTLYMNYYHDLKVEKKKQTDGTTIYVLTDLNNEKVFQFASRSVAWPPGYGG
ncbi:MAG: hypothetical protein ABIA78_02905 [archaeon]